MIIPAYNEEKDLPLALSSLMKQNRNDFELIVIDDGSTDHTRQVIRDRFPKVILLEQDHQGPGAARNLGAHQAKGKILVFTDADIILEHDTLSKLVGPIEAGQHKATGWFNEKVYDPENTWSRCWQIAHRLPLDSRMPLGYDVTQARVFRAVRKDFFWELGGFKTNLGIHDDNLSPEPVPMLKEVTVYHKNPRGFVEVWQTAAWIGKGTVASGGKDNGYKKLLTYALPKSIVVGLWRSIQFTLPQFLLFKIYFDLAVTVGILKALLGQKVSK